MARTRQGRIAHEVAEASRATDGKRRRAYPATLIAEARELERALAQRKKIRRDLKRVDAVIRQKRKLLKALAGAEIGEDL